MWKTRGGYCCHSWIERKDAGTISVMPYGVVGVEWKLREKKESVRHVVLIRIIGESEKDRIRNHGIEE